IRNQQSRDRRQSSVRMDRSPAGWVVDVFGQLSPAKQEKSWSEKNLRWSLSVRSSMNMQNRGKEFTNFQWLARGEDRYRSIWNRYCSFLSCIFLVNRQLRKR